jgi:predicted membrane protein
MFGITMLINAILGIHIPIGRIFFGFLLCYAGYYCIVGRHKHSRTRYCCHFCHSTTHSTTLDTVNFELNENTLHDQEPFEYTTTLGTTIIDLTNIYSLEDSPKNKHTLAINTVLGKTIIKINKSYSFCIQAHGTCSHIALPHGQKLHTNSHTFCHPEDCTTPDIQIHAHTVLGTIEIVLV